MPPRGIAVDFPAWWLEDLARLMRPAADGGYGVTRTQLAEALVPRSATGDTRKRAINAARVKVTRFLDDENPSRTIEVAEAWCAAFNLPRFHFEAADRKQAVAMQIVQGDPAIVERVIAAKSIMMSLESGEHRMDGILAGHTGEVASPHGVVGRGSRDRESGPKTARR